MNLAFWKYKNLVGAGRPIEKVSVQKLSSIFGKSYYESHSYLSASLIPNTHVHSVLYGDCTGTGTASTKWNSIFKSLSESVERWAYFEVSRCSPNLYGLSHDCSTTGFAAFPELSGRRARIAAKFEAFERWSLLAWWNGEISIDKLSSLYTTDGRETEVFRLSVGEDIVSILVCLEEKNENAEPIWSYGFASASNIEEAITKAIVEMERNLRVLRARTRSSIQQIENMQDARLLYFSTLEGSDLFRSKISMSLKRRGANRKPKVTFDGEIKGPWSDFAKVWRVLYEMPYSDSSLGVFYF